MLDTDGLIAALVAEKAALSEQEAATLAPRLLDQFLNFIYRSLKNERDGRELAARMDAAEAIRPMIGYVLRWIVGSTRTTSTWSGSWKGSRFCFLAGISRRPGPPLTPFSAHQMWPRGHGKPSPWWRPQLLAVDTAMCSTAGVRT